jgi:parvulin-like peptidyl-prolyl isomerase
MTNYRHTRSLPIAGMLAAIAILYGCGRKSDSSKVAAPATAPALTGTSVGVFSLEGSAAATPVDARPAAIVDGTPLDWGRLRPALTEAAGADVLRELVLDQLLEQAVAAAGITITPDDVAGEQRLLLENLSADVNESVRLLQELRDRQKLGTARFALLLRRNASLRALVRDRVQVTDDAVRQLHAILHGPRRQARLITTASLHDAEEALRRIEGGEPFADVAVALSTDSSAARGGLLEPISREDPAYPPSIREALWSLHPGERTSPVLMDRSFAILQFERDVPGDSRSLEEARPDLERQARLAQEQALMDQLARQLLNDVAVGIFDESLDESWKMWKRARQ